MSQISHCFPDLTQLASYSLKCLAEKPRLCFIIGTLRAFKSRNDVIRYVLRKLALPSSDTKKSQGRGRMVERLFWKTFKMVCVRCNEGWMKAGPQAEKERTVLNQHDLTAHRHDPRKPADNADCPHMSGNTQDSIWGLSDHQWIFYFQVIHILQPCIS